MEQRRTGWRVAGTLSIVGLLALSALQLHALEARLTTQSQQLRVLGEATERIAAQLEHVQGEVPAAAANPQPSLAHVLHPDVKDFLTTKDTHWPPPGAGTNGTISFDWPSGDPKGFNPVIENAADLMEKLGTYVESRVAQRNRWTNPDTLYGDLAWRVEVTDDYKTFTIYLKKGIKWHPVGGVDLKSPRYAWLDKEHPLTAHDFVFYFDMVMHPQVQNGFIKSYYEQLASWKALDDYTLEVVWKKKEAGNVPFTLLISPLPRFLYAFAEDGTPIPESTLGLAFNQHWYNNRGYEGTGPYRMAEYTPGNRIRLERNEDYFDERPAIKTITYPIYSDRSQTVLKLKSGELSFGLLRSGQYREEVLKYQGLPASERPQSSPFLNGQIKCDLIDQLSYAYIGWNGNLPLFADRRVRTALTLALNRQEIITKVFNGMGKIARGPFLESSGNLAPEIQPLPFDLKRAAALLAEAGWVDTDGDGLLDRADTSGKKIPFEFSLLSFTSPEWIAFGNVYKEDLLSIGIKMTVEIAQWSQMQKRMDEKQFDAFTGAWLLTWYTDPYQMWHSSQADVPKGSNQVGFRNPQADALLEQLRATLDPGKRIELSRAFHRILHEEQPYTFVYTPRNAYCYKSGLQNVVYAKERPLNESTPWWSTIGDG
jgi:peptide/nickel transport system substrate-binding protein